MSLTSFLGPTYESMDGTNRSFGALTPYEQNRYLNNSNISVLSNQNQTLANVNPMVNGNWSNNLTIKNVSDVDQSIINKNNADANLAKQQYDWNNSGWGKFSQGVDIANGAMNVLNTGFSLYSNIADYSTKRAMNKEKLENARLTNQALREDMQNRRNEIARLGKMRSNAAAQQASGSINTRG